MRTDVDPRLADAGLALAMTLVLAVVVAADPDGRGQALGYAFAAGFGAALLLRRRFPRLLLAATVLAIFGYYILDLPPVGMVLPAVGALFSAAEQGRTGWAVGAAAVLLAVSSFFRVASADPAATLHGYTLVTELALAAASIALGATLRLSREARERTAQLARLTAAEQRHAAEARMQEERLRIARDLHDTIGHALSVASLHAGVAAEAADAAAARAALERVRTATGEALRELRRTVKVLRDDGDGSPPASGLERVEELFAAPREAGLRVEAGIAVAPGELAPSVDAAAYRIVQEALTNVMRHAGPQATLVRVSARVEGAAERALVLRVADDGRGAAAAIAEGSGIRGMRERARLLGGELSAGPVAEGFAVEARIPARDGQARDGGAQDGGGPPGRPGGRAADALDDHGDHGDGPCAQGQADGRRTAAPDDDRAAGRTDRTGLGRGRGRGSRDDRAKERP